MHLDKNLNVTSLARVYIHLYQSVKRQLKLIYPDWNWINGKVSLKARSMSASQGTARELLFRLQLLQFDSMTYLCCLLL